MIGITFAEGFLQDKQSWHPLSMKFVRILTYAALNRTLFQSVKQKMLAQFLTSQIVLEFGF